MNNRIQKIISELNSQGITNYENYHIHSSLSNITTPDCAVIKLEFAKRALQLGQKTLSSCEHGLTTLAIESYDIANEPQDYKLEKKLKFIFAVEAYYVEDRFEKDDSNRHVILMAKNIQGMKDINKIVSESQKEESFYYKPRIDWQLLTSIDEKNIVVTSACVGGLIKGKKIEILEKFNNHFSNFYLEIQSHRSEKQKEYNIFISQASKLLNIPLISACDSHFIFPEQSMDRDAYLLSKGISYPEEDGWDNDYPDIETLIYRYVEQGVLSDNDIIESIKNTNIVNNFDDIHFDKEIKVPTMFPDLNKEQKDKKLRDIVYSNFEDYCKTEKWVNENKEKYIIEIEKELDVISGTDFADYFLLNYYIIQRGEELGGKLTA
ncbi:MAG: PHP domain-containing protein [Fusobacteriaceae bacterium]